MKFLKVFIIVIFSSMFLLSCEEDPLSPDEDLAKSQQAGIDFLNQSDTVITGGGGGNGGGSNGTVHFNATVDGVSKSSSDPYMQFSIYDQIISSATSASDLFLVNIFGGLSEKTIDNPSISYFLNTTSVYEAFNGQLVLEKVTADLIEGTFFFDGENSATMDTISVTAGSFRVER